LALRLRELSSFGSHAPTPRTPVLGVGVRDRVPALTGLRYIAFHYRPAQDTIGADGDGFRLTAEELQRGSSRLLAGIDPEARFDSADAAQPIDMAALFTEIDADELAEASSGTPNGCPDERAAGGRGGRWLASPGLRG
jgi:hypothetical protein